MYASPVIPVSYRAIRGIRSISGHCLIALIENGAKTDLCLYGLHAQYQYQATKRKSELTKKCESSNLKISSWNIKRGLVTKEIELRDILNREDIDILFLNETDSKHLAKKADYQING